MYLSCVNKDGFRTMTALLFFWWLPENIPNKVPESVSLCGSWLLMKDYNDATIKTSNLITTYTSQPWLLTTLHASKALLINDDYAKWANCVHSDFDRLIEKDDVTYYLLLLQRWAIWDIYVFV